MLAFCHSPDHALRDTEQCAKSGAACRQRVHSGAGRSSPSPHDATTMTFDDHRAQTPHAQQAARAACDSARRAPPDFAPLSPSYDELSPPRLIMSADAKRCAARAPAASALDAERCLMSLMPRYCCAALPAARCRAAPLILRCRCRDADTPRCCRQICYRRHATLRRLPPRHPPIYTGAITTPFRRPLSINPAMTPLID